MLFWTLEIWIQMLHPSFMSKRGWEQWSFLHLDDLPSQLLCFSPIILHLEQSALISLTICLSKSWTITCFRISFTVISTVNSWGRSLQHTSIINACKIGESDRTRGVDWLILCASMNGMLSRLWNLNGLSFANWFKFFFFLTIIYFFDFIIFQNIGTEHRDSKKNHRLSLCYHCCV